jgi:alkylation response protein AidB-like acyl-CoA dehydrogenase
MDFEFTDDQLALRDAARTVLQAACPPSLVRATFDGAGDHRDLWTTLVSLDWPALGLPEVVGGLGLSYLDVCIVVEELGRTVAPTPYLPTVTQFVPFIREAGSTLLLGEVAHGSVTGTAAIAEAGRWWPEAQQTSVRRSGSQWQLTGTKTHVLHPATVDEIVVVAGSDDGRGVFVVPRAAVEVTEPKVIDPTWPVGEVILDHVEIDDARVLVEPGDPRADTVIERSMQEATTAIALSTVATCRALVETTIAYTKDREQFGRPIGSFQALKHRLADCYLSVERAAALGYFAALTIAEDDDRRAIATSMAKAAAGATQRLVVRDALQLHGGVGFTWEQDLHFRLKRAKAGDLLFGNEATHRARLARLLGLEATT